MLFFIGMCLVHAQEKSITGTVTDQEGFPLPGVNIIVQGTTSGTQTDFDGNYSIQAEEGQALIFSYIGQRQVSQTVGVDDTIDVQMQEDAQALDEVVLTGVAQGTSKKKLGFKVETVPVTGVQTVPTPDAASALIGKVAGAQIVQGGGNPLRNSAVILRGASSIEGSTAPLNHCRRNHHRWGTEPDQYTGYQVHRSCQRCGRIFTIWFLGRKRCHPNHHQKGYHRQAQGQPEVRKRFLEHTAELSLGPKP